MADPTTTNILLAVPTRGSNVGTWDEPVNANSTALDGMFGGVVTVGLTSSNVTLTAPTGSVTPAAGPTQSQNQMIKLTGTLTANVKVRFPLPGRYIVANSTTGSFVVTFDAPGAGQIVAVPQGSVMTLVNDGTDVYFADIGQVGKAEFWDGISSLPAWVSACTNKPYLIADGTVYNIADYPYLGALFGSTFGGNGTTTFAVPDKGGRVPLAYDSSGARITVAGCGVNGQTIGATGGSQTHTLVTAEIPAHTHTASVTDPGHTHAATATFLYVGASPNLFGSGSNIMGQTTNIMSSATTGISVSNSSTGGGGAHNNVQPIIVAGIWVVRAG